MRPEEKVFPNSRGSEAGAGWSCATQGTFGTRMPDKVRAFSWRRPSVLWGSRNDVVAKLFGDPSRRIRRGWVAALRDRDGDPSFTLRRTAGTFSFLVLGDTGEGDRSQYAVVPGALKAGAGTDFMIICSDVIYPAGAAGDYEAKFFRPYADYRAPIYAVPGNHDWYDGLHGFMRVLCDLPDGPGRPSWRGPFGPLARLLWRSPAPVDDVAVARARERHRGRPEQQGRQPGPYWAIDTPALRIVGIDTGIDGVLDLPQSAWLREVSRGGKPKLLITGKPLYVDDDRRPGRLADGGTVDDIVRDRAHHYVAAIGGDIHNYQRYPVRVADRTIQYVVAGGGGAFMHATHVIHKTTVVGESEFRCYPLRGDSLSRYSRLYGRWLRLPRLFDLTPEEAHAVVGHRLGIPPTRSTELRPSRRVRLVAALLGVPRLRRRRLWRLRLPVRGMPQMFRSEFADWDQPPFFKSFLRVDVTEEELTIHCFAATGCGEHEECPPCEDSVTIDLRQAAHSVPENPE